MWNEEKKRILINKNVSSINDYLVNLSDDEIERFYLKMEDILYFYGFKGETIRRIIESHGLQSSAPNTKLAELEGVTNAMLFHLKYKMELKPVVRKEALPKKVV